MKVIIAGCRHVTDYEVVKYAVKNANFFISEVVSGDASGVDKLGVRWAMDNGLPFKLFPADWNKYGRSAGPVRNGEMAKYADGLIAIWDGESKGTKDMIKQAEKQKLRVFVYHVDLHNKGIR